MGAPVERSAHASQYANWRKLAIPHRTQDCHLDSLGEHDVKNRGHLEVQGLHSSAQGFRLDSLGERDAKNHGHLEVRGLHSSAAWKDLPLGHDALAAQLMTNRLQQETSGCHQVVDQAELTEFVSQRHVHRKKNQRQVATLLAAAGHHLPGAETGNRWSLATPGRCQRFGAYLDVRHSRASRRETHLQVHDNP